MTQMELRNAPFPVIVCSPGGRRRQKRDSQYVARMDGFALADARASASRPTRNATGRILAFWRELPPATDALF